MPAGRKGCYTGLMLLISWLLLFILGVASLYLPYVQCYYWRGFWRWLALLPLCLPLGYVATVVPRMLAAEPDHSINGELFFSLVLVSVLLSLGLRVWHAKSGGEDVRKLDADAPGKGEQGD